jgi:hypothetical protein
LEDHGAEGIVERLFEGGLREGSEVNGLKEDGASIEEIFAKGKDECEEGSKVDGADWVYQRRKRVGGWGSGKELQERSIGEEP